MPTFYYTISAPTLTRCAEPSEHGIKVSKRFKHQAFLPFALIDGTLTLADEATADRYLRVVDPRDEVMVKCPCCEKEYKRAGIRRHIGAKHPEWVETKAFGKMVPKKGRPTTLTQRNHKCTGCGTTCTQVGLNRHKCTGEVGWVIITTDASEDGVDSDASTASE